MDIHQPTAPINDGRFAMTSAVSPCGSEADALEAAQVDMTATICSDLANGLVGQRHNTYGHRSRILRQMSGWLTVMRERDRVVTS